MSKPMVAAECCTRPPVVIEASKDYQPKGKFIDDAELGFRIYQAPAGASKSDSVIIHIYDIWGYAKANNNWAQVADILAASSGIPVIVPDVFHGEYFTMEMMQSGKLMGWVGVHGDWKKTVKSDVEKTFAWAQKHYGAKKAGIIGFCYGGKMVVKALAELPETVVCGATCHPSFLQMEDADPIKGPICLLPSKDEDPKISAEFLDILKAKPFGSRVVHKRFDDMFHGWAQTRGDFSDPVNNARAKEAIQMCSDFFARELGVKASI